MANHNFDIYRKMSLLLSDGIHLADILHFMGIEALYVYGAGEIGKMTLSDLSGTMKILAVFDQSVEKDTHINIYKKTESTLKKENRYEYPLYHPDKIPDDENVILITPASMYSKIIDSLMAHGISKYRFLSLNLLLYYGMYYRKELNKESKNLISHLPEKQFLITGAQFSNKGSQSMLFVAMNEIRKRFKNAVIWYCPNFADVEYKRAIHKYKLIFLLDGKDEESTLYELLPALNGIIDVSGYALSSNVSINATDREMNYLKMARDYQIPVYLMPQSFGPFDYEKEKCKELRELLSYARIIYAREQSGYDLLVDTFALTNVKRSIDLVLQNKEIKPKDIYIHVEENKEFNLATQNNVAIIPNVQNYRNGDPKRVLQIYWKVVEKLLLFGKQIYIISHSEDEYICEDIYEPYKLNTQVHLYGKKFDCLEFNKLVRNFQYIIASRFHAVIHAYKMNVPCIVIGWAEKYKELLKVFEQKHFLFDVRESIDIQDIFATLSVMENSYEEQSKKIASILPQLQTENCFDILDELFEKKIWI